MGESVSAGRVRRRALSPAANDRARLATSSDLPTFGSPPTNRTVQVALSFLLLIGAGLFVRTLHNLETVDPGFRHKGVLMADLDGRRIVHAGPRVAVLFRDAMDAVTAVHGVTAAALSNFTPIGSTRRICATRCSRRKSRRRPRPARDRSVF